MRMLVLVRDPRWSISTEDFCQALTRRWPASKVVDVVNSEAYTLRWTGSDPDLAEGQLSKQGRGLAMEGTVEACARVASWWRELVPAEHAVAFFDQGYNADVDVTPGMTATEIVRSYV